MAQRRAFVAVFLALVGCSGADQPSGGDSDAGAQPDGGSADGAASGTEGGADASGPSAYCAADVAYYQRCGKNVTAACVDTKKTECQKEEAVYSAAFIKAATACMGPSATCDEKTKIACEAKQLSAAQPTPAQAKLRDDYCKTCAPTSSTCSSTFYTFSSDGTSDGPGYFAFVLADTSVQKIDAQCTGSALQHGTVTCKDAYSTCSQQIYSAAILPLQTNCN